MADKKGNLVAGELVPSPPAHNEPAEAERSRTCIACARYHGSEGGGKACLEGEVKRLRTMLREFPAHAETLRGYRAGVAQALALGPTASLGDVFELLEGLRRKDRER
jgi:hypothetical protein